MLKKSVFVALMLCFFALPGFAGNDEKLLVIKGLHIGMDADEAKVAIDKALPEGWIASGIDTISILLQDYQPQFNLNAGDEKLFGNYHSSNWPNAKGILIKKKSGYFGGFIKINTSDNRVSKISFGKDLVNDLFSLTNITADEEIGA